MLTSDYLDARHGGVESHVYYVARALIRAGHDVEVVRLSSEPARFPPPDDVPLRVVPPGPRRDPYRASGRRGSHLLRELRDRVGENLRARPIERWLALDEDVAVHQHNFLASARLSRRLARRHRVFWTNHLGEFLLLRRTCVGTWLLRRLTAHYRGVMAPSRELADLPWLAVPVVVQANGVDAEVFRKRSPQERVELRHRFGWGEEYVVLVPRRWAPTKGVIFAAEAMALLPEGFRFVFVGSANSEYPAYARAVQSVLAGAARVHEVHDHLAHPELADRYAAADLTLIPSVLEATSLAILESMACGCPVLATAVGGSPELISDGVTGFLVPPGDSAAIASRILELRHHDPSSVSEAAAELVRRQYSWEAAAEALVELYSCTATP